MAGRVRATLTAFRFARQQSWPCSSCWAQPAARSSPAILGQRGMAVEYGKSKVPPGSKTPPPPAFGGSVLGGSLAPAPSSPTTLDSRPKRKVEMIAAPEHKAPVPKAPLSAEDLSAGALRGLGIGGLDSQLEDLFRRAFASRLVPPEVAARMGLGHVKGILLYGPPGTGKTLIARKIASVLMTGNREPEIINGPELLQRFVGQSEANIRTLFESAEAEYKKKGEAADLHVLIFDEVDALCKARGSGSGAGSGHSSVGDSVVNQLLTKMDGVDSAPNVLVIGLTNRRDLLDEALLRPGRFEVQMEVGLPDANGRHQVLEIHTKQMAENGMLASCVDLRAVAESTKNFSGAELAGLVRSAASHAYHRLLNPPDGVDAEAAARKPEEQGGGPGIAQIRQEDFLRALKEVTPALGAAGGSGTGSKGFKRWIPYGILQTGTNMDSLVAACRGLVAQVKGGSQEDPVVTALLEGPPGAGKTAIAATVAMESGFPFARVVCASDTMVGMGPQERALALRKAFDDAFASPLSVLVLDNLERILGFSPVGPEYSNVVLQTLMLLLRRQPPEGRRLLVLATTSSPDVMKALAVSDAFDISLHVKPLTEQSEKAAVLREIASMSPEDAASAAKLLPGPIPIKRLLRTLRIAASAERFDAISAAAGDPGGAAKPRGGDGDGEAAAFSAPLTVFGLKSYLEAVRSVGSSPHGLYQHQVSGHTTSAAGGSPTIWVPSGSAGDK